jgi:hypothetical protein
MLNEIRCFYNYSVFGFSIGVTRRKLGDVFRAALEAGIIHKGRKSGQGGAVPIGILDARNRVEQWPA